MDTALPRQFLDFFQEFLNLYQLKNWPGDDTSEAEIKNAFLMAQHVEKCLDKFQKKNLLNEFLIALNSNQNESKLLLKNCFTDPPKCVLKKIINSNTKIAQMDVGFRVFLQLYSAEILEKYLSDIMLEAASKETLLQNLTIEFSNDKLIEFKSNLFLSELISCEDPKYSLTDLIQNSNSDTMELLVVSLLNRDLKYQNSVDNIVNAFIQVMTNRNYKDKQFWKLLFIVDEKYFIELCLRHSEIFRLITTALLDCGKLLQEHLSSEFFYIDLTYSELAFTVQKINSNENLKIEFLDIIKENNSDTSFWENMIQT